MVLMIDMEIRMAGFNPNFFHCLFVDKVLGEELHVGLAGTLDHFQDRVLGAYLSSGSLVENAK